LRRHPQAGRSPAAVRPGPIASAAAGRKRVAVSAAASYRFGRFELNPAERLLRVDGAAATITAKAFDLLIVLVERAGRLVTKDELLDLVWPRVVVEENNLQVQISTLRKILGQAAIATIPGRGYRFTLNIAPPDAAARTVAPPMPDAAPPSAAAAPLRSNVPRHVNPLFGRDDDLAALMHLLETHRLVTITGPGGIGKTRLAQAVAIARQDLSQHGAAWVELAPIADSALVASTIATAVRVPLAAGRDPVAALASALQPLALLLVLDNAEHVVEVVRQVAHALAREAPGICLLVTSQLPLKLAHERVYRLGALEVPDAPLGVAQALEFGSVALFAERAAAADRRFALTEANLDSAIEICRRVDGLALALELAAARVPLLGLAGVARHLDQRFRLLVSGDRSMPSRQQTLHAAFDWSHGLLTPQQQRVFRRLCVFAGGFTLELAGAVVADDTLDHWTVVDLLGDLIDRSLVAVAAGEAPRYHLLETGRAYALEQLAAAGELEAIRRSHARALQATFEQAFDDFWTMADADYREHYEPELDNLRAAFAWATANDAPIAVALAATSDRLLLALSLLVEARQHSDRAIDLIDVQLPEAVAARFWCARAAVFADRPDKQSRAAALRAIEMYREFTDPRGLYIALHYLAYSYRSSERDATAALSEMRQLEQPGWPARLRLYRMAIESTIAHSDGRLDDARVLLEEQIRLALANGVDDVVSSGLGQLAAIMLATGDVAGAIARGEELVAQCRRQRNLRRLSIALANCLHALLAGEALERARATAVEFAAVDQRLGWSYLHRAADAWALIAALEGRMADAARLAGFADRVYADQTNYRMRELGLQATRARVWGLLQQAFDPATLGTQMSAGAELGADSACALALGPTPGPS